MGNQTLAIPNIIPGDWKRTDLVIRRIKQKLGAFGTPEFQTVKLTDLTASRLVYTDANQKLASVSDLTAWIAGTANQVIVADDGDGTVTFSTPQDIHTGATNFTVVGESIIPTLSTTTALNIKVSGDSVNRCQVRADGLIEWGDGTNAVDTNLYRSGANELRTDDLFWADNLYADTDIVVRNAGRFICLNTANTSFVSFKVADALAATTQYTLPSADGTDGQALITNGSAVLSWNTVSSVAGNDTEIQYNDGGVLAGDSNLAWIKGTPYLQVAGDVRIRGQNGLLLWDSDNSHYTRLKAHATTTTSVTYILPPADGTGGYALVTDGSGNLSWSSAADTYKLKVDLGATGDYLGAASNDGVLRVNTGISYTDGGNYITLGLDISSLGALGTTIDDADYLLMYDTSTSAHKKVLSTNLVGVGGITYVDRGDPSAFDYSVGDFTTDTTWRDLDLSSIVPDGATVVHLYCVVKDDAASSFIHFRKNGNTNTFNEASMRTQVANVYIGQDFLVSCDSNRVIEYYATNTTWSAIYLVVKGWFI